MKKKYYFHECPVTVDWQSPDCESQILMVSSLLPLAICFPSGLHATDLTLKLREGRRRIITNREKKTGKNLLARVPGQGRLAFSRLRVPNLNSAVTTAAGKLISIGAPCHRHQTVTQKVSTRINRGREKKYGRKLTHSSARSALTGNLQIARPKS